MKSVVTFFFLSLTALLLPFSSPAATPIYPWQIEVTRPAPEKLPPIRRGETIVFQPQYLQNGRPIDLSDAGTVILRYKPQGTALYHMHTGAVYNATNGSLRITWNPSCESTNSAYLFDILVGSNDTVNLRAYGTLTLAASISTDATLTNVPQSYSDLDWSRILNRNSGSAPWLSTNSLGGLVGTNDLGGQFALMGGKWSVTGGVIAAEYDLTAMAALGLHATNAMAHQALLASKYDASNPTGYITVDQIPAPYNQSLNQLDSPAFYTIHVTNSAYGGGVLAPDGIGLSLSSSFAPNGDVSFDLGYPNAQWRDVYAQTLHGAWSGTNGFDGRYVTGAVVRVDDLAWTNKQGRIYSQEEDFVMWEDYLSDYLGNEMVVRIPPIIGGVVVRHLDWHVDNFASQPKCVILPDTVESIGASAFLESTNVISVYVGDGLTNIDITAFSFSNVKGIYYSGNAPTIVTQVPIGSFYESILTNYYLSGMTGFGTNFGGRPTAIWGPKVASAVIQGGITNAPDQWGNITLPVDADAYATYAGTATNWIGSNAMAQTISGKLATNGDISNVTGTLPSGVLGTNSSRTVGMLTVTGTVTAARFSGGSVIGGLTMSTNPITLGTNSISMSAGVLTGTNGVYWTYNSTNYWLLLTP